MGWLNLAIRPDTLPSGFCALIVQTLVKRRVAGGFSGVVACKTAARQNAFGKPRTFAD
jgi:hypothetical protein